LEPGPGCGRTPNPVAAGRMPSGRRDFLQAAAAIIGTGLAFAFLEAGAFTDIGTGTLRRMVAPDGLRSVALGAAVTAALLIPAVVWQARTRRPTRQTTDPADR
jgi:hypothetical protein